MPITLRAERVNKSTVKSESASIMLRYSGDDSNSSESHYGTLLSRCHTVTQQYIPIKTRHATETSTH